MSTFRLQGKILSRGASVLAVLAYAGSAWLLSGTPVAAQQVGGLRGEVREESVNGALLGEGRAAGAAQAQPDAGFDPPPYVPDVGDAETMADSGLSEDGIVPPIPSPSAAARTEERRRDLQRPDRSAARRVPSDEDVTTATVPEPRVDSLDENRNRRAPPENDRVSAIEALPRTREENPYAPLGLRLGSFIVTTRADQGLGWTSNANSSPNGDSAVFSETGLRLNAVSDWSRHAATLDAYGTFRKSISGGDIREPEGGISGNLRLDLVDGYSATAAAGYLVRPESASSPFFIEDTVSRPDRHTLTGSLGLAKDAGKLRLAATGDVVRDIYGDAELSGGGHLPQDDRNSTLATVKLRGGYNISPALTPFLEGEVGRRIYDEEFDQAGYERSADRLGLRAGLEFDRTEKFRGEISAGWLSESPDDDRLETISGLSVAGNVSWSPVRGTTVALSGATYIEGSGTPGESGSILYSANLALTRELRANLTGTALLGLDWRDYSSSDIEELTIRSEASLTWWLNRYAGITGRARYETLRSDLPDREYDAGSVYLGMTLQR
ncbi:outer membrane beta-barrel protein [Aquamicrobium sp. LC103]|uniref:outer membrane beta-barrel protein n=1 Tax=Aquamicrobium sp. LC103 TaxID=1120658 RepID=UPI00063EC36C|nr:outer membrane beta-barrel protein [Aquamicrobium sp. LC103]TKT77540.1 hypothetical protein XW59_013820 [Aquamicrobium sp. LC103]